MALLTDDDVARALETLSGWTREGNAIAKQFTFASFPEAIAFVNRLVAPAEAADHHPDLAISYRRVTVRWSTHSEGGITKKDVAGAQVTEELSGPPGSP
jgi:4a-hydroxytetrahydrobiopterin dehydratase